LLQAGLDGSSRLVVEVSDGFGDVGIGAFDVPRLRRLVLPDCFFTEGFFDSGD